VAWLLAKKLTFGIVIKTKQFTLLRNWLVLLKALTRHGKIIGWENELK
jgi:hypothetical protein